MSGGTTAPMWPYWLLCLKVGPLTELPQVTLMVDNVQDSPQKTMGS